MILLPGLCSLATSDYVCYASDGARTSQPAPDAGSSNQADRMKTMFGVSPSPMHPMFPRWRRMLAQVTEPTPRTDSPQEAHFINAGLFSILNEGADPITSWEPPYREFRPQLSIDAVTRQRTLLGHPR